MEYVSKEEVITIVQQLLFLHDEKVIEPVLMDIDQRINKLNLKKIKQSQKVNVIHA